MSTKFPNYLSFQADTLWLIIAFADPPSIYKGLETNSRNRMLQDLEEYMHSGEYILMDKAEEEMWWYKGLHFRITKQLKLPTGRILDAGCGTGGLMRYIRCRHPSLTIIGVDINTYATKRAMIKSGSSVVQGDVNKLPFPDAAFDAAISADVLSHHKIDPLLFLQELRRVVKTDGVIILNMPAFRFLMSSHDKMVHNARRMSRRELITLLRDADLDPIRTFYWNIFLFPFLVLRRKMMFGAVGKSSDVRQYGAITNALISVALRLEYALPIGYFPGSSVLAVSRVKGERKLERLDDLPARRRTESGLRRLQK